MSKQLKVRTKKDALNEKTFIAFIVKGNRQIINRDISASKRFWVDGNTYIVRDDCIFYKNIDGHLRSVCFYRENNPNPYHFNDVNIGITPKELDDFFAEDLFHIVNDIEPENRSIYVFIMSIVNLLLCALFMVSILMVEFVL